jgi:hypothetical protein
VVADKLEKDSEELTTEEKESAGKNDQVPTTDIPSS